MQDNLCCKNLENMVSQPLNSFDINLRMALNNHLKYQNYLIYAIDKIDFFMQEADV